MACFRRALALVNFRGIREHPFTRSAKNLNIQWAVNGGISKLLPFKGNEARAKILNFLLIA